jgi:hypothetical protein
MSVIPVFGSTNGVQGSSLPASLDGSLETVVAVMYNYYDPNLISDNAAGVVTNSSNRIVLNPYLDDMNMATDASAISLNKFLNMFYPTNSGYFNVNPTNANNPAVLLSKQSYTSSNSRKNNFSLTQFLLRAYCTNKGLNVNDLDPRIMILLQKETFTAQSLASIKGTTISMSWDEVINSLIRSGVMDASGNATNKSTASVPLSIVLNYHSFVLDTDLSIRFTYLVNISGYALPTLPACQPTYN